MGFVSCSSAAWSNARKLSVGAFSSLAIAGEGDWVGFIGVKVCAKESENEGMGPFEAGVDIMPSGWAGGVKLRLELFGRSVPLGYTVMRLCLVPSVTVKLAMMPLAPDGTPVPAAPAIARFRD